jgi:hypothetical protein
MTLPRIASHFILLVLLAVSGALAAGQGNHDDNPPPPPPPPPSSNRIVTLRWNPSPTAGISAYKVYRRANLTIAPALLGVVPGTTIQTFDTVTGAPRGQKIFYSVSAQDSSTPPRESPRSTEVMVTIP